MDTQLKVLHYKDFQTEQSEITLIKDFIEALKEFKIFEDYYPIGYTDILESNYYTWYFIASNDINTVRDIIKNSTKVVYNTDIADALDENGDIICVEDDGSGIYIYRAEPMFSICTDLYNKLGLKVDFSRMIPSSDNEVRNKVANILYQPIYADSSKLKK